MKRYEIATKTIEKSLKDENFKKELIADPKATIEKEFGVKIPVNVNIKVLEETKDQHYLILPMVTKELTDAQLKTVAAAGEGGGLCQLYTAFSLPNPS